MRQCFLLILFSSGKNIITHAEYVTDMARCNGRETDQRSIVQMTFPQNAKNAAPLTLLPISLTWHNQTAIMRHTCLDPTRAQRKPIEANSAGNQMRQIVLAPTRAQRKPIEANSVSPNQTTEETN